MRERTEPKWLVRLGVRVLGVLLFTVGAALITASSAHATFSPDFSAGYTQTASDNDCQNGAIDPVNFEFHGGNGGWSNTSDQIGIHAHWHMHTGSSQKLKVHIAGAAYDCQLMDDQRASGASDESRFHIRLWNIPAASADNRKTVGDAHHEDYSHNLGCRLGLGGHAVDANGANGSGFDKGRRTLMDDFVSEGHAAHLNYWGNTANFEQCDGGNAGSNGYGAVVFIGHTGS